MAQPLPPIGTALALLLAIAPMTHALAAQNEQSSYGVWANPRRSVQVRFHPCGEAMCGTVVWASEKAQADSRKGGTDKLIGARLFTGFVRERSNLWRGRVFVPDLQRTFSGTITLIDPQTLRARGCLIGRIGCRSQDWTRVKE